MAESEGFEPPIALRLCLISSQVHSTGLCQLSTLELTSYGTKLGGPNIHLDQNLTTVNVRFIPNYRL